MNRSFFQALALVAGSLAAAQAAQAQALWDDPCHIGFTTSPYSIPYAVRGLPAGSEFGGGPVDSLFAVTVGLAGTNTYSRTCFGLTTDPAIAVAGGIGFSGGAVGSIQSDKDDYLRMTYGMPFAVGGNLGYAVIVRQDAAGAITKTRWGAAINTSFYTASDRAAVFIATADNVTTTLRADQVGDAVRFSWTMQNQSADATRLGLWFGQLVEFMDKEGEEIPQFAESAAASYVYAPGYRPFRTPTTFSTNSSEFPMPEYLSFSNSRENAYGLRLQNLPTEGENSAFGDLTPVDELRIGQNDLSASGTGLLGLPWEASTMPETQLEEALFTDYEGDPGFIPIFGRNISGTAYIQKWQPAEVNGGASRQIVSYYRGTWGNSSFQRPYAVVVDAPKVFAVDPANPTQFIQNTQVDENGNLKPAVLRVYIDNIRGYTTIDQEVALEDIRVTLSFTDGRGTVNGTTSPTAIRSIPRIAARAVGFVDFPIRIADDANGQVPYRVSITTRTQANRVVEGTINASAQPRLRIRSGANLIATPFTYGDGIWSSILGLQVDTDFRAFTWDPQQGEYVIQSGPQRGSGTWLISDTDRGTLPLQGDPAVPADLGTGAPLIQLKSGWNLIANPYPYAIPLAQLVGVSATNPEQAVTYRELVQSGVLSGAVAFYDQEAATPEYVYLTAFTDVLAPNRGYWIFVQTDQDLTLSFPPVFEPFVPDQGTGPGGRSRTLAKTTGSDDWTLQLAARSANRVDAQNFVGVASQSARRAFNIVEAPLTPEKEAISLSVVGKAGRRTTKLARSIALGRAKQTFDVDVVSRKGGAITVTWPNVSSIPRSWTLRAFDPATRRLVDLRASAGLALNTTAKVAKRIQIIAEPVAAQALFSDVRGGTIRTAAGPIATLDYRLLSTGKVSIRVLDGGALVATIKTDATESTGLRRAVWPFRDAANRPVRSGTYTLEITVTNAAGDRQVATAVVVR